MMTSSFSAAILTAIKMTHHFPVHLIIRNYYQIQTIFYQFQVISGQAFADTFDEEFLKISRKKIRIVIMITRSYP